MTYGYILSDTLRRIVPSPAVVSQVPGELQEDSSRQVLYQEYMAYLDDEGEELQPVALPELPLPDSPAIAIYYPPLNFHTKIEKNFYRSP